MAKRTHPKSRALALYRPSAPKPIVIKQTKVVKARKHRRRGRGGGGGAHGLLSKERVGVVVGAFLVGLIEKQGIMASLPTLPLIGRTGTIAIGAYLLSNGGRNKMADEVCTAAAVLAAHSLGSTGTVVGEGGVGDVSYVAGW